MTARCSKCGTEDESRLYRSGKMKTCKDCQRFYNVTVNSKRVRAHAHTPAVSFTREEFLEWSRQDEPTCAYCGVAETDLARLGIKSSIGLTVEALGVDRVAGGDYTLDAINFCCYACNKVKGNVFSDAEMRAFVGPAIAAAWKQRLEAS